MCLKLVLLLFEVLFMVFANYSGTMKLNYKWTLLESTLSQIDDAEIATRGSNLISLTCFLMIMHS